MPTLSRELRRVLENTVVEARRVAEAGAQSALEALAVDKAESFGTMCPSQRELRRRLRARARQLGDLQGEIGHLTQACAYEHWHRMLFARFLAENGFLLDPHYQLSLSMEDVRERARELGRDWLDVASEFAQRMLLDVFRLGDPVLEVALPPEKRQQLEMKLEQLPADIFIADDSLGWVYQFWQKEEKDRVNHSETKIGADQLAAVTQLFTEDYMVLFLLHNTLGAWWTAQRIRTGSGSAALEGYEWSYLRLNEDGTPAAGNFDGWPKRACELRVLDPCMGSGHFLTFALPIIARMRMVEENLSIREAICAALRDNLLGLELDARCSQIAAFNLALTAWRLAGEVFPLPKLKLACSGLGINASEAEWMKLANGDSRARTTMQKLYELFQKAPTLGSLIDPTRVGDLITARFDEVQPLLERALAQESAGDEGKELAIAAEGLVAAARILAGRFTLVATNVPYLGRGKQDTDLTSYCERFHNDAKADIATCFADRILRWCTPGGSAALVTPQNWLFLTSYRKFRERLLREDEWDFVARLGERAFESSAAAGAFVALLALTRNSARPDHLFAAWDLGALKTSSEKSTALGANAYGLVKQNAQSANPDSRISLDALQSQAPLSQCCFSYLGLGTGDYAHYGRVFWEFPSAIDGWTLEQASVNSTQLRGGREHVVAWDSSTERVRGMSELEREQIHNQDQSGQQAWGRVGVAVGLMRELKCTLYSGEKHDKSIAALIPEDPDLLPALWCFCSSTDYNRSVRRLDQNIIVANGTLVKVPFDKPYWRSIAAERFPEGLPRAYSSDPTQWLFNGHPKSSDFPLQVAVARVVGYRWLRQTGSSFADCPALGPDGLEIDAAPDGIVCLHPSHRCEPAHVRVRELLANAFGDCWSAQKLADLVGNAETLENWLLKRFFREHCDLFHARPFIWHVWDGRSDGFNALVNYHKLAGPNGEGRRTLERLIYTYLSYWIRIQEGEIGKVDGADARLVAAQHLRQQLEAILKGEPPFDIFIRWKPIQQQPIGWEPDLNDGIRLNIRPWLEAKPYKPSRRDACILRETPIKLPLGKDRGKEPSRDPEDFPWFATSTDRTNDIHLKVGEKRAARDRKARR